MVLDLGTVISVKDGRVRVSVSFSKTLRYGSLLAGFNGQIKRTMTQGPLSRFCSHIVKTGKARSVLIPTAQREPDPSGIRNFAIDRYQVDPNQVMHLRLDPNLNASVLADLASLAAEGHPAFGLALAQHGIVIVGGTITSHPKKGDVPVTPAHEPGASRLYDHETRGTPQFGCFFKDVKFIPSNTLLRMAEVSPDNSPLEQELIRKVLLKLIAEK